MLQLINIEKSFPGFRLHPVNLQIHQGEYYVLLGQSGAGKSLLLEIIAGITRPDHGRVMLDSKDISNQRINQRNIGVIFQDISLFPHMLVFDNIAYPMISRNIGKTEVRRRVDELSRALGVSHLINRKPDGLSGGESQRVALARVLATSPKLLLLDEPLTSLDVLRKDELIRLLKQLNQDGMTILHVTHEVDEALSLASHLAILHDGKLLQSGSPEAITRYPASPFVARLMEIKNCIEVIYQDAVGQYIAADNHAVVFHLPVNPGFRAGHLLIHQKHIRILEEPSAEKSFSATITDTSLTLHGLEITVDIGIPIVVQVPAEKLGPGKFLKGALIRLNFNLAQSRLIPIV
ncbi:MAG: ABC transporter ATP-binding protein [Bacteroidetes bacterium]|nr:ABC transporter ATP-binding protein [Bacteroidota bacterium]